MRTIKILGLAATAALMAMAVLGASSASATSSTALCKVSTPLACAAGDRITHVHESTLPGNENRASLLTIATIRCQVLYLGDVLTQEQLATAPAPLVISGTFTYTECNLGCSVTQLAGTVATIKVLKTAPQLAAVTGEGEVLVNCPLLGLHCVYNGVGLEGHGLGAGTASELNGETRIEEKTVNKVSGSGCPETSKLDLLTTPILEKVYINS